MGSRHEEANGALDRVACFAGHPKLAELWEGETCLASGTVGRGTLPELIAAQLEKVSGGPKIFLHNPA